MYRLLILFLVAFSFTQTACSKSQMVKDSWKYTKKQYSTYLNRPANIDMEATGSCEPYEIALGDAVLMVDSELHKLQRAMENSDSSPDQAWVMRMMQRFPWLSGVALADGTGKIAAQYPEQLMKQIDLTPLLEPDPKQHIGALRGYVQNTPLGPEVYLANPVYKGEELRGLIVAFFDPRILAGQSSNPGSFMLTSPSGVLWEGRFGAAGPVAQTDWATLLTRDVCGTVGTSGSEFFWTTRFLGNLPLVYAIPVTEGATQPVTPAPAAEEAEVQATETENAA